VKFSEIAGIKKINKSKNRRKIYTAGVIITGILSILLFIITFYGQNTGNFTVALDEDLANKNIELSIEQNFLNPVTFLSIESVEGVRDITYTSLKFEEIRMTDGVYNDPDYQYFAFSFYIRNSGLETVDINYYIRLTEIEKNFDSGIRFLVIEDDDFERIYQSPDSIEHDYQRMPESINFISKTIVLSETIKNFKPNEQKRFSLIIWLEGQDPDTTDDLLGGKIKALMKFVIDGTE
jgi:hypothetical protein